MGEYLKIINSDYNILGFEKFLYIYAISLSFLLIGESVKSIETFIKVYNLDFSKN